MTTTIDQALTEMLRTQMPLAATMKVDAVEATSDRVVAAANWQPAYCGAGGVLHGGYLMALADSTGAILAFLNLGPGDTTTTLESKTNFFRPATEGRVLATSTIVHQGQTTIVVQTDITNETASLVSRTTQTQAVLRPTA